MYGDELKQPTPVVEHARIRVRFGQIDNRSTGDNRWVSLNTEIMTASALPSS